MKNYIKLSDLFSQQEINDLKKKAIIQAGKEKGISNSKIKGLLRELNLK